VTAHLVKDAVLFAHVSGGEAMSCARSPRSVIASTSSAAWVRRL